MECYKAQISTTVFAIYSLVCQVCFTYQHSSDGVRTKQNTQWSTFPLPKPTGDNYLFPFTANTERMCGLLVIYTRMLSMPICVALIHAFIEQTESLKRNPSYKKNEKKRVCGFHDSQVSSVFPSGQWLLLQTGELILIYR